MVKASLKKQLARLEGLIGDVDAELKTALFVEVVDTSLRDPDDPDWGPKDYSEDTVIGVYHNNFWAGKAGRVTRRPGESLADLKKRAKRLTPMACLFYLAYSTRPREFFDALPEVMQ